MTNSAFPTTLPSPRCRPSKQKSWLNRAEKHRWSVNQLRHYMAHAPKPPEEPEPIIKYVSKRREKVERFGDSLMIHGDCREILPQLKLKCEFDIVSDPPYGQNFDYGGEYKDVGGEPYVELLRCLLPYRRALMHFPEEIHRCFVPLFGPAEEIYTVVYRSNTHRQTRQWCFWGVDVDFGRVRQPPQNFNDKRVYDLVRAYDWTDEFNVVKNVSKEKTVHPCPLPVAMMERILSFICAKTICDPFAGSGTTCLAALNKGRRFIGIEQSAKFFDTACERLERAMRAAAA